MLDAVKVRFSESQELIDSTLKQTADEVINLLQIRHQLLPLFFPNLNLMTLNLHFNSVFINLDIFVFLPYIFILLNKIVDDFFYLFSKQNQNLFFRSSNSLTLASKYLYS